MIEAQKPAVAFAGAIETSQNSILIGEVAKILRQGGYEIGQNRLFSWLREIELLCSYGERWNKPSQRAMEMGLFEIKEVIIQHGNEKPLTKTTTKVTGKGQIYIINKYMQTHSKFLAS